MAAVHISHKVAPPPPQTGELCEVWVGDMFTLSEVLRHQLHKLMWSAN